MADQQSHELKMFMRDECERMAREYERISSRTREDPGTAGDQGEENWKTLLEHWLPPPYQIVTKGRILGLSGKASRQVDVLVLHPYYPKALLATKLYLAAGVLAAFECKLTLEPEHITEALKKSILIRSLAQSRFGTPYKELYSPIIYGVLAHSHCWKAPKSDPLHNVSQNLLDKDDELVKHPRESLDLVCVADLGVWVQNKHLLIRPAPEKSEVRTGYFSYAPQIPPFRRDDSLSSVGAMLQALMHRLAWEDPTLRPLAEYFESVRLQGGGQARVRRWGGAVFSDKVAAALLSGDHPTMDRWDEWSAMLW